MNRTNCADCDMPQEFREICQRLEDVVEGIKDTPATERFDKFHAITAELMLAAVALALAIGGPKALAVLFQNSCEAMGGQARVLTVPHEEDILKAREIIDRLRQGGKDAQELKQRAMLNNIPDNAPRH